MLPGPSLKQIMKYLLHSRIQDHPRRMKLPTWHRYELWVKLQTYRVMFIAMCRDLSCLYVHVIIYQLILTDCPIKLPVL